MQKKKLVVPVLLIVVAMFASACSSAVGTLPANSAAEVSGELVEVSLNDLKQDEGQPAAPAPQIPIEPGLLAAYENTLTGIYEKVSPSVVNIRVIGGELPFLSDPGQLPPLPDLNDKGNGNGN